MKLNFDFNLRTLSEHEAYILKLPLPNSAIEDSSPAKVAHCIAWLAGLSLLVLFAPIDDPNPDGPVEIFGNERVEGKDSFPFHHHIQQYLLEGGSFVFFLLFYEGYWVSNSAEWL